MTLVRMSLDDPDNEKLRTLDFLANKLQNQAQSRLRQKMFTGITGKETPVPTDSHQVYH